MVTRMRSRRFRWLLRLVILTIASVQVLALVINQPALAQTIDSSWTVPLNLSHSGAATNPAIIIDSDSVEHAVWLDGFKKFVYARFDGTQWSNPQETDLHLLFGLPSERPTASETEMPIYPGPNPLFLSGPNGYITGFWVTPKGLLYTGRVYNRDFMNVAAWENVKLLSASAAYFSAAIDLDGELHLAYIRTIDDFDNTPGIYYMHTKSTGLNWSLPKLLYESPYFRTVRGGEANLSLATGGTAGATQVSLAWDNRARKQVFFVNSTDGGTNWGEPVQIAGPAPDSGAAGPHNIRVGAIGPSTVLIWQSTNQDGACSQYFQSSTDAGATWSQPQLMARELLGCAQANEFVTGQAADPGDYLYLLTNVQSQVFLSAWNGSEWSEPQAQPILSSFEDPEIFTRVDYGCHRGDLFEGRLYIVGCDQGRGGDIWTTSRDLETTESWFASPVWSQPVPVTADNLDVTAVKLAATKDNRIHAVFSQFQNTAIYYTRWDGASWSLVTPVMQLPDGEAGWPAIASGPGDELFLIARSSQGSLFFSQAHSSDAVTDTEWSTPARIPVDQDGLISPADIACDASGRIYVVYSIPVNDGRGVYLIQSEDQGKNWSEPHQVFDGADAGFDLVGSPSLLVSNNGLIYVTWSRYSSQTEGVSQPLSLYGARSEDLGQTFSDAEIVVDAPVTWGAVEADGQGNLHRLWQRQDEPANLWNQVSYDAGRTWQGAQVLPSEGGRPTITRDPSGRLHLLGLGTNTLLSWLWDGSRWQSETPLHWSLTSQDMSSEELSSAAAVDPDGKLVAVLEIPVGAGGTSHKHLYYSTRTLDPMPELTPVSEPVTLPELSPTDISTPTSEVTQEVTPVEPTATVSSNSALLQGPIDQSGSGNSLTPYAVALLPVALLLLTVLGLFVRRIHRINDR